MDWLSRLFEMMPVRGRLDLRASAGEERRCALAGQQMMVASGDAAQPAGRFMRVKP